MAGIQLIYNERDIEDILELHCEHYLGLTFLARQFRTPVGIIDVIAKHREFRDTYYVIELKRGTLDGSAYVQAARYARWLNSELSKDGTRLFYPIVIGENLHSDLNYICEHFDTGEHRGLAELHKVTYRLFNFDPIHGVSFDWQSAEQQTARELYTQNHCHIEAICERIENYELDEYFRTRDLPHD